MKKISYDFYYNSNAISKAMLEQEFGRSWKRKFIRDEYEGMNSILISTPMGRGSERGLSFYGTGKQTVPSPDNEKDDRRM
jgi:hypothetical protein